MTSWLDFAHCLNVWTVTQGISRSRNQQRCDVMKVPVSDMNLQVERVALIPFMRLQAAFRHRLASRMTHSSRQSNYLLERHLRRGCFFMP